MLPLAEALAGYPRRAAAIVAGLLGLALVWYACLPSFFYGSPGILIEGPLPAIAGMAVALYLGRDEPPFLQAVACCAWGLLALLGSVLVFGTWYYGPLHSISALWEDVRSGFHLPFSALIDLWGNPRFVYGFWTGLRPLLLAGAILFVVLSLWRPDGRGRLHGLIGGLGDQHAFHASQRQQRKAYQAQYLAAVRAGEAPPPLPDGLMPPGGSSGLLKVHLVLRIGLTIAGALGIVGGSWALLGDALKGPLLGIFWRGLAGG